MVAPANKNPYSLIVISKRNSALHLGHKIGLMAFKLNYRKALNILIKPGNINSSATTHVKILIAHYG
jgi:hypothetical protein